MTAVVAVTSSVFIPVTDMASPDASYLPRIYREREKSCAGMTSSQADDHTNLSDENAPIHGKCMLVAGPQNSLGDGK
jgi:hypothetical protein